MRLKIIDLEGGDQPIVSDDGDTAIAFNGEIYNHREIRAELESLGHRFRSHCDTETVLRAFLEWDTACFARMRGMFAVALWTESRKRLVLVRDRMGIKPLYYYRSGDDLYFGIGAEGDSGASGRAAATGPGGAGYVPVGELRAGAADADRKASGKLPPGHLLEWRHGKVRDGSVVDDAGGRRRDGISLEAAKEELDCLLRDCGARASGVGRSAGRVGVGRAGFVGDSALRGGSRRRGG